MLISKLHIKKKNLFAEAKAAVDKVNKQFKRGIITKEERHEAVIAIWSKCTENVKRIQRNECWRF